MTTIPTSDLETFKNQIKNPNKEFDNIFQKKEQKLQEIKKDIVLSFPSDHSGCGHIRNIFPFSYMNSLFARRKIFNAIISNQMIFQEDILRKSRSLFFQRTMSPGSVEAVNRYKTLQNKFQYKMVYDIDDFVWVDDKGCHGVPEYNFGGKSISKEIQDVSFENMKKMDTICVTSQFLKDYISKNGIDENKIKILHNSIPQFFWGNNKKTEIKEKIKKPRIMWSASPSHWCNKNKLYGDMDNAWREWIIKSVKEDKIEYVQMGGLPWFFEEIKDKIKVVNWIPSFHYHLAFKDINADIGISPLVPNYFNYSKSPIKYQEYCVSGTLGIGTVFSNGKPSPYDISLTTAPDTISVEEIDALIDRVTEPEVYNDILNKQYQQVIDNSWITESKGYIDLLFSIF